MAVTDLTNTKWVFNDAVEMQGHIASYNVTFSSNNNNYTLLEVTKLTGEPVFYLWYNTTKVDTDTTPAIGGQWTDEEYRTIEITGGTDVTNASLISWLIANATQQIEPSSDVIETTISVGTNLLADASIGTTKLLKAFIGSHLIFERLGGNFLTSDGKVLMTSDNKIFNVQPGGFSGNILGYGVTGNGIGTYIKFDTPPSSVIDSDSDVSPGGTVDGLTSYSGKTKLYAWGYTSSGSPKVKINNVETVVSTNYGTPTEIVLDGDYDIYLGYAFGSG